MRAMSFSRLTVMAGPVIRLRRNSRLPSCHLHAPSTWIFWGLTVLSPGEMARTARASWQRKPCGVMATEWAAQHDRRQHDPLPQREDLGPGRSGGDHPVGLGGAATGPVDGKPLLDQ